MKAHYLDDFFGSFDTEINVVYPKNNDPIFEMWLLKNYHNYDCSTGRYFLPIQWTAYYVNNNYGNDKDALSKLQDYINRLPTDIKYWTCIQYDDSILNDVSRLDLLQFNMSKTKGVMLPLLCQPHPYKFLDGKKWFANFVGSRTHPIRDSADRLAGIDGYYISFERTDIETYCRVMHESMFTLCYRGYGANSFRCAEAIQYGSIPVMISDEFILPSWVNFEEFGVLIKAEDANRIDEILSAIEPEEVINKQSRLQDIYEKYYTFSGCFNQIIKSLETEFDNRKEEATTTRTS